ncbi:MAG: hypothetical protein MUE73_21870 [Planctomycetes bacterium]|nr:hypothetical protein [Planctomycetota bacterium]
MPRTTVAASTSPMASFPMSVTARFIRSTATPRVTRERTMQSTRIRVLSCIEAKARRTRFRGLSPVHAS